MPLSALQPAEAVQLLNIPARRLKTWVQEERVPYQCAGVERGVWFTAEDIRQIAHKSGRQLVKRMRSDLGRVSQR